MASHSHNYACKQVFVYKLNKMKRKTNKAVLANNTCNKSSSKNVIDHLPPLLAGAIFQDFRESKQFAMLL